MVDEMHATHVILMSATVNIFTPFDSYDKSMFNILDIIIFIEKVKTSKKKHIY